MATAVISGIALFAPIVADVGPKLITLAERVFPATGAGPQKMDLVLNAISGILSKLGGSGTVQATAPSQAETQAMIEALLSLMKANGSLSASTTPPAKLAVGAAGQISAQGITLAQNLLATIARG